MVVTLFVVVLIAKILVSLVTYANDSLHEAFCTGIADPVEGMRKK
jgi:hypothetical protein